MRDDLNDHKLLIEWVHERNFFPYTHQEFEQAFWHLWTLNNYHITGSFDVNMVLLLDWCLQFHMDQKK